MGRIGVEAIVSCSTGHQFRSKKGTFEKEMTGLTTDAAPFSAHDACHGEDFLMICNDQSIRCENAFLAIEQLNALLGLGLAHPNAAFQRVEIKGM